MWNTGVHRDKEAIVSSPVLVWLSTGKTKPDSREPVVAEVESTEEIFLWGTEIKEGWC